MSQSKRRVGVVGYGHLGRYLVDAISSDLNLELAFVWNRSSQVFDVNARDRLPIIEDLERCGEHEPDVIVEVAHPNITKKFGALFLKVSDFLIGSPTALSSTEVETNLKEAALRHGHTLYVPSGALWGGEDIRKMADLGTIKGLRVTMRKHPSALKLLGSLQERNDSVRDQAEVIYEGPVRDLCPLAPNNVNTMAAAAVAAHNLGFDGTIGRLISDPTLRDWHYVEVSVEGPSQADGRTFVIETIRKNPSNPGAVTGSATYASFLSSIHRARGKGPGVHLC